MLEELTGKKHILLTSRGNKAILLALKIAKSKGYKKLAIADQGSWITYAQYGRKLKFNITEIKTDNGLINFEEINNSAVIFNDMPSYAFLQNETRNKSCFYIGDITGSIGTRKCSADILVCSFGENKIINLGNGGMIASNEEIPFESDFKGSLKELENKICGINARLKFLREKRKEIIKELKNFEIIKNDGNGINILVKYRDEEEKNKLITFFKEKHLDFKLCPMRIKVMENAVSIEIQNFSKV